MFWVDETAALYIYTSLSNSRMFIKSSVLVIDTQNKEMNIVQCTSIALIHMDKL